MENKINTELRNGSNLIQVASNNAKYYEKLAEENAKKSEKSVQECASYIGLVQKVLSDCQRVKKGLEDAVDDKIHIHTAVFLILVIGISCLFSGCGTEQKKVTKNGFYFDTIISITLYGTDDISYIDACFTMAKDYEEKFSNTINGSIRAKAYTAKCSFGVSNRSKLI